MRSHSQVVDAGAPRMRHRRRKPPPHRFISPDAGLPQSAEFPCSDCHDPEEELNLEPRRLEDAHETLALGHGAGGLWCLDCHDARQRDRFAGGRGESIDGTEPERLCGRCHMDVARDAAFGVHGKRLGSYRGEGRLLSCLACHRAHAPGLMGRRPAAPPRPRADLPAPIMLQRALSHGAGHRRAQERKP
ncbi:MAG: hypothetical protein OEZ06_20590 [Myxococcales bacterium]|nr:hypothetical protein [Myxococcales bacterium]